MGDLKNKKETKKDYSKIGYYGRPITDLGRDELLAAFAGLAELYKESQRKNERCKEVLGKERYDSL